MKIIKVLVDEMPSGCKRCDFCVARMYCRLLEDRKTAVPDEPHKRRADCPLVYDFGDRETNALNKRVAELERDKKALRGIEENLREHIDIGTLQLSAATARIAELEAETAMLKQLSQPIEFWSDEKIQIYKSNESRTMKSGNEEREE